jgi:hypothetical protein
MIIGDFPYGHKDLRPSPGTLPVIAGLTRNPEGSWCSSRAGKAQARLDCGSGPQ